MNSKTDLISDLKTLNQISQTLNQAVDVHGALNDALAHLVQLMELDSGWIFLSDPDSVGQWWGKGYSLAAHYNLPPALDLESPEAWKGGCDCQGFCTKGKLSEAYNEVRCSRLTEVTGEKRGLAIHASAPLRAGVRTLGILNVAASDWEAFSPRALALLSNTGDQMGVALERARLYDLLQERRIHEQATLLELSNQLLGRLGLDELMDYLVAEVVRLLQVDAAALLLQDHESQALRFRAAAGWRSNPIGDEGSISGKGAFGQILRSQEPLTANAEGLKATNQREADLMSGEGFQALAAVPLIADETSIGVLTINTHGPRDFSAEEVRLLQLMANQAAIAIDRARLREEEIQRQKLEEELTLGRQIQLSLLPRAHPTVSGWQFSHIYRPARQVGGDFYDFFEMPGEDDRLGLVIGDVADKGVPAALFMGVSRTLLRSVAQSGQDPGQTLLATNHLLFQESWGEMFLSAFYGILETGSGQLTFANAGHNRPLWYRAGRGEVQELKSEGVVLCVLENISLTDESIHLEGGDLLILYTDGVTEAMSADYEEFGEKRLKAVVESNGEGTAEQILGTIVDSVEDFARGMDQSDDFTVIVVKRL